MVEWRTRIWAAGALAALLSIAGGAVAAPQYTTAFGYELGEERRYVLEPHTSLRNGESAWWSIVLADIEGAGENEIVFDLAHERTETIHDMFGGESGRQQTVSVEARLTVNRFGFPGRLSMTEQHDVSGSAGSRSERRTTEFTFDGERLVKKIRVDGREWEFNISIANHDDLDLELPAGMYAYVPTAMNCLGRRGVPGRPARCGDGDPIFANPGLLSLALPVLWEEQVNEKEFLFFKPSGIGTDPSGLIDMRRMVSLERDQLRNYNRYYEKTDLEVKEYAQSVEIGPRRIDAWMLDGSGDMGEFYTDADGKIFRVDIGPHPVTYGKRWIRLLFSFGVLIVLEDYSFKLPIRVRFADTDMMGHVNNAAYVTYFESGRVEWWLAVAGNPSLDDLPFILARTEIDFLAEARAAEDLVLGVRAGRLGNKSFDLEYLVVRHDDAKEVARGRSVQVMFDYREQKTEPISDEVRRLIAEFESRAAAAR